MPATICGISLWISGSPPGMDTMGAPHSSTALERVFDADPLLQDFLRVVDFPAAGAGEIALEQRLQHEHQRIALVAAQLAPGEIFRDPIHL